MEKIIRYRYNIMNVDSIPSFANLKGGYNQNCRDVYFVRALGRNENLIKDIQQMDQNLENSMREGRLYYKRISQLPPLVTAEEADYYSKCYEKWMQSRQTTAQTKVSKRNSYLSSALGLAAQTVLRIYEAERSGMSESIRKNFIVKLFYWFDCIMEGFLQDWNERSCIKIAAVDIAKEQEYLFFYLLTLVGCDVLLIQTKADIKVRPKLLKLSKEFVTGEYGECRIPKQQIQPKQSGQPEELIRIQLPERNHRTIRTTAPVSAANLSNSNSQSKRNTREEKSFEDLAMFASSVVMVAIHDQRGEVIGTGSGIMIGENGYILTNNHVAAGGSFYSIRIEDDQTVYQTDEVIKYHSVFDLALLRIDRKLNPIPIFRGSQKLARGQKVVAIGSPLGLFNSISDGIISGFRSINGVGMIQFTAPISHGSSGGAVLNMYGELIGISTAGFDRGQNINLAVGYECINAFIKGFA